MQDNTQTEGGRLAVCFEHYAASTDTHSGRGAARQSSEKGTEETSRFKVQEKERDQSCGRDRASLRGTSSSKKTFKAAPGIDARRDSQEWP